MEHLRKEIMLLTRANSERPSRPQQAIQLALTRHPFDEIIKTIHFFYGRLVLSNIRGHGMEIIQIFGVEVSAFF
jgi:hypothetical protein